MKMRLLWELFEGINQLEDVSVCAMMLLKSVLNKIDKNCGLDWTGLDGTELQEIRFNGILFVNKHYRFHTNGTLRA